MYHMSAKDSFEENEQRHPKATFPHHQLDWRWVERYRELASFDSYSWLAPAGPFMQEEQQQWDQLYSQNIDEATKEQLGKLIAQSCQRELLAAIAEQREPLLYYPAIPIEEVRSRMTGLVELDEEIRPDEANAIVRRLYHDTIEEEIWFLRLIEATYEGNSEKFWEYNLRLNPVPTQEEMHYILSRVRHIILQGLQYPEIVEASERLLQFLRERLHLSLDISYDEEDVQDLRNNVALTPSQPQRTVSAQPAKRFFEAALRESGYREWQVHIDPNASSPRVEQGLRHLYLPESQISIQQIKNYLAHEMAGHVARCIAGERSLLGLLGIHTKHSLETEEGLAVYHDIQTATLQGQGYDETRAWFGTLATGLASGVITPPQTFLSLFTLFESFIVLYRLLKRPDQDAQTAQQQARRIALERCLRTYRGVPDLERAGVCYTKDAHSLRGLRMIEDAIAKDVKVLDQLAAGVVSLDRLPDLQELGIITAPQPLRKLVQDPDLDSYILSFEAPDEYIP